MEKNILGRNKEKKTLKRLLFSKRPVFLAVYGRRRVGKTFLINEFFENAGLYFEIIGSKNTTDQIQMARFCHELSSKFYNGKKQIDADDWDAAFNELKSAVDQAKQKYPEKKIILFFDEIPWIDNGKGEFLGSLDYAWNKYFSKSSYRNIILIVCGSAASWIIRNIINNKGGLHNRVTDVIKLMPFSLPETETFLKARGLQLEHRHIVELYMVLGGVPAYLERCGNLPRGWSSTQIINELCFGDDDFFIEEYNQLFSSLFNNYRNHVKVVRALAKTQRGLTRSGILDKTGLPNNGKSSLVLKELEEAGFLFSIQDWGKSKKLKVYRLGDEYSGFYLQWIEPSRNLSSREKAKNYWTQRSNSPSFHSWAGYAFENVCMKYVEKIKQALGISGILTSISSWSCTADKRRNIPGAQIDLIIKRADNTINLCEIKYVSDAFLISRQVKEDLERKKTAFKKATNTRSQLFTTLITSFGAKENKHFFAALDNQLTMECLF